MNLSTEDQVRNLIELLRKSNFTIVKGCPQLSVNPYLANVQFVIESLESECSPFIDESIAKLSTFNSVASTSSEQHYDPRLVYAAIVSNLLHHLAKNISSVNEPDILLSTQSLSQAVEALSCLSLVTVHSCDICYFRSGKYHSQLLKLWPRLCGSERVISQLMCFTETCKELVECAFTVGQRIIKSFTLDILIAVENLKVHNVDCMHIDSFLCACVPAPILCQFVLELLRLSSLSKEKHGDSLRIHRSLNIKFAKLVQAKDGIALFISCMDSAGSMWNSVESCETICRLIIPLMCSKNGVLMLKEFRTMLMDERWGDKLSLLVAAAMSSTAVLGLTRSPLDVYIVKFIAQPFQQLWEGIQTRHAAEVWSKEMDSALWLAYIWHLHASKMIIADKHIQALKKVYCISTVLVGLLSQKEDTLCDELLKFHNAVRTVAFNVLSSPGVDRAQFILDSLIALASSKLVPMQIEKDLTFAIEDSDKLVCDSRHWKIQLNLVSATDVSDVISNYMAGVFAYSNDLEEVDRGNFIVALLGVCIEKWSYLQGSSETWSDEMGPQMALELLFSKIGSLANDDLHIDENVCLKLLDMNRALVKKMVDHMSLLTKNLAAYDIAPEPGVVVKVHAKTVEIAFALTGVVVFKVPMSEKIKESLLISLPDIKKLITAMKLASALNVKEFDLLHRSSECFEKIIYGVCDGAENPELELPSYLMNCNESAAGLMDVILSDFSEESVGSFEVAERGHAIIALEKMLRQHDEALFEEVGGLNAVFDALSDNLRHFDSYIYLAGINALTELALWKHKSFIPKLLFLFRMWDSNTGSEDESSKIQHYESIRCRVQLAEAIAKVIAQLGEFTPSYFTELSNFFLENMSSDVNLIVLSSISGLSSLIIACQGKYFTKDLHEILAASISMSNSVKEVSVRRAAAFLMRSIIYSCNEKVFEILQHNLRSITMPLRKIRDGDSDDVVRSHADSALLKVEEVLKSNVAELVEKSTRIPNF